MSKHTDGPWLLDANGYFVWTTTPAGLMKLCDIRGWGHLTGRNAMNLTDEEAIRIQRANGELIAAAPKMLEELKFVVQMLTAYTRPVDELEIEYCNRVQTLINKLEGKT